jgi:hypothetical protein
VTCRSRPSPIQSGAGTDTSGVERSAFAVVHPQVMWSALRGLVSAPSNPLAGGTDQTGLPADILLDGDGVIVGVHYGAHADDQWSVDDLLAHVAR